jgi:hypothetical protein
MPMRQRAPVQEMLPQHGLVSTGWIGTITSDKPRPSRIGDDRFARPAALCAGAMPLEQFLFDSGG